MIKLSLFETLFDNRPKLMEFDSFDNFEQLLYNVSKMKGVKFDKTKPKQRSAPLISPATFKTGTTRKNDNVIEWSGWCCVDVDEYTTETSVEHDLHKKYGHLYYVCYSTASSTAEKPRFRLVFPLKYNVPQEKIKHFWYALNKELGEVGDGQTKDLARMYYVPAIYPNANNFIFTNKGEYLDPFEYISKHPYAEAQSKSFVDTLPPAIRDAILKEKKSRLVNTDVSWSSYHDCAFWPSHLEKEYRETSSTGWYNLSYRILVACAGKAAAMGYPLTAAQLEVLFRQFDNETGGWYKNRPLRREAEGALQFVLKNSI